MLIECDSCLFFRPLSAATTPRYVVPFVGKDAYERAYHRSYLNARLGYWLPLFDVTLIS